VDEMYVVVTLIFVVFIVAAVVISGNIRSMKLKTQELDQELDMESKVIKESSGHVKIFREFIITPVSVSETGEIGVFDAETTKTEIVNIKDVRGFELIEDGKNVANIGGAVVGGLLFGGVGAIVGGSAHNKKITKMDLVLKIDDFKKPYINIPLYRSEGKKDALGGWALSPPIDKVQEEIKELVNTLEFVEKKIKG